jgi:hypothetical protein
MNADYDGHAPSVQPPEHYLNSGPPPFKASSLLSISGDRFMLASAWPSSVANSKNSHAHDGPYNEQQSFTSLHIHHTTLTHFLIVLTT